MSIKMRIRKTSGECYICGKGKHESLELFDLQLGIMKITICDLCNSKLLRKTLNANHLVDSKLKTKSDMRIRRIRSENNEHTF